MTTLEQRKSILNLYNSGITPDIIALEMDLSQEDITNILKEVCGKSRIRNNNKINLK